MRHPALTLLLLALTAALLGAVPVAGAETTTGEAGAREAGRGCTPLDDAGLVQQLVGVSVRVTAMDEPLRQAMTGQAGTAVLFGPAIDSAAQVRALVADLDVASPDGIPPVVAVDEEGGRVARFGQAGLAPHLPPARTMAAQQTPDQTRAAAADVGRALAGLGVDLDLAPVLDLSDAPADSIIGDRSFSADAAIAGDHGAAFAAGLGDAGVAAAAKHFPDHGLTETDTHTDSAVVDISREQLRQTSLEPYRRALPQLDAIMLSHLRVSSLDPHLPASLSAAAVDFLRSELASDGGVRPYDGVVATDDLSMRAVAAVADQPTAAVMAIAAGADLALIGDVATAPTVHDALRTALGDGTLPEARVRTAARRVLALKDLSATDIRCLTGAGHYRRHG